MSDKLLEQQSGSWGCSKSHSRNEPFLGRATIVLKHTVKQENETWLLVLLAWKEAALGVLQEANNRKIRNGSWGSSVFQKNKNNRAVLGVLLCFRSKKNNTFVSLNRRQPC